MQKGSFCHYLQVIFYDVPLKNIIFKRKIALRFWCPLFHVFKIIKMGGFGNPDSVVPLLSNPGVKRKTIGFS